MRAHDHSSSDGSPSRLAPPSFLGSRALERPWASRGFTPCRRILLCSSLKRRSPAVRSSRFAFSAVFDTRKRGCDGLLELLVRARTSSRISRHSTERRLAHCDRSPRRERAPRLTRGRRSAAPSDSRPLASVVDTRRDRPRAFHPPLARAIEVLRGVGSSMGADALPPSTAAEEHRRASRCTSSCTRSSSRSAAAASLPLSAPVTSRRDSTCRRT